MTQKVYSIVFCALLATTFIYEIGTKAVALPEARSNGMYMDAASENKMPCNADNQTIVANDKAQLYGVFNKGCNVGYILDVRTNIVALVNGTVGAAVVIDLTCNSTFYIPCGLPDLETLLRSSSDGLKNLLDNDNVETSALDSEKVLEFARGILCCLLDAESEQIDPKEGLELITAISERLVTLSNGVLKGILQLLEEIGSIVVPYDLAGKNNWFEGFSKIFTSIPVGLKGVSLDLKPLTYSSDGIDFLAKLLLQIGCQIDIQETVGPLLNDPENFLEIVALLGGRQDTGVDGLTTVLSTVACYLKGEIKLEAVINVIIKVITASSEKPSCDLKEGLEKSLKSLLSTIEELNAEKSLSGLVSTINDLLNDELEIDGVNLSNILDELIEGVKDTRSSSLEVLVTIMLEITKNCKSEDDPLLSILLVLIIDINDPIGIQLLKDLDIGISDKEDQECGTTPSNVNCDECDGGIYDILTSISGIRELTESLETAISQATCGNEDLKDLVNNDDSNDKLKAVLQIDGYCNFDICEDILEEVRATIDTITSLSFFLGVDVCPKNL